MSQPSSSTGCVDLALLVQGEAIRLAPRSVLGMVWLQTHFEACHWQRLATGHARISPLSAARLGRDARAAGLLVARLQD